MIYFRLKNFSNEINDDSENSNSVTGKSNKRAGFEAAVVGLGAVGSSLAAGHYGMNSYNKYLNSHLEKDVEYNKANAANKLANENFNKAEANLAEMKKAGKIGTGAGQVTERSIIDSAKLEQGKAQNALNDARRKVLDKNHLWEKGVGKGMLKGGAVLGLGLGATWATKKLLMGNEKRNNNRNN